MPVIFHELCRQGDSLRAMRCRAFGNPFFCHAADSRACGPIAVKAKASAARGGGLDRQTPLIGVGLAPVAGQPAKRKVNEGPAASGAFARVSE